MNKKYVEFIIIFLFIFTVFFSGTIYGETEDNEKIFTFDLSYTHDWSQNKLESREKIYDHVMLATSLQGIANRNEPKLYLKYVKDRDDSSINVDEYWLDIIQNELNWLQEKEFVSIETIDDLLENFNEYYEGAVIWDPEVPATVNLASTIAGIEDLIVIRYDTDKDSLYSKYIKNGEIKVKERLLKENGSSMFTGKGEIPETNIDSTGSAKGDAYLWAKEKYLDSGLANGEKLGYYMDSYVLESPWGADWANWITNRDYFISEKGFFFDLSPVKDETPIDDPKQDPGTDFEILNKILKAAHEDSPDKMTHIGGYVPWGWKYTNWKGSGGSKDPVDVEWTFVQLISAYNAYLDADAVDGSGIGIMANGSFYQHFPLEDEYPQKNKPTKQELAERGYLDEEGNVKSKRFISFYVGDFDSAAWVYQMIPGLWDSEHRGDIPLSWAINPNLEERAGPMMAYMRKTKSENDFFVTGPSGAGYINPGMLKEPRKYSGLPSGIELWKEHNIPYYQRWDISVTGFIIDGHSFATIYSPEVMNAYTDFSNDGMVLQKGLSKNSGMYEGMPIVFKNSDLGGSAYEAAGHLLDRLNINENTEAPEKAEFEVFRGILKDPQWYKAISNYIERNYDKANIKFVDMYSLFKLIEIENDN